MGSIFGEDDEIPVHTVTISRDFFLVTYEVTQEEWATVMGENPSMFLGDDRLPVDHVTWYDILVFTSILNAWAGGDYYRLPTEAEWEYAARAGTTTVYSFGEEVELLADYGWFRDITRSTQPVGLLLPNPWVLYDMHGNVFEWVNDWYSESYYTVSPSVDPTGSETGTDRVFRSGGWHCPAEVLRSAFREKITPTYKSLFGFRIARMMD